MGLRIRPAMRSDEADIVALHTASWRRSYRGALSDDYLDGALAGEMRRKWHRRLTEPRPGWLILVAATDDAFAGFFAAGPDPDDPSRDLIDNLHVWPALQSRGIGAALMCEAAILWVVEDNLRARGFYRVLGGREDLPEPHAIAPGREVSTVPICWDRMQDIATAARRRLARGLAPPVSVSESDVAAVTGPASGADHPVPEGRHAAPRRKQRLGEVFGLTDYGVNRVVLGPGVWSAIAHWNSHEDEFVYLLEGELVLVAGAEERLLRPGDCAGFPAGLDRPHHLENRSDRPAVFLEVGSRRPDRDECDYPGKDLRVGRRPDGSRGYLRRDGTPLPED